MCEHISWTSRLFRALYSEGVRHVYISPGSRSTPLVFGVAAHPGFVRHVVLDERSAAFQALGTGKASGLPALLICTSGTAAANYHPAIIEARQSGVPMIVISADRPPSLRGTGSSQTIDQLKMFGDSAVFFHELGEPVHREEDYRRLDLLANQAVRTAADTGGAVHINAPFRKPLEPTPDTLDLESERNRSQLETFSKSSAVTLTSPETGKLPELFNLPQEVIEILNRSVQPLLVAGPDEYSRSAGTAIRTMAETLKIPVIAEPGSHVVPFPNIIGRYDIILRSGLFNDSLKPDLIISTGDEPISRIISDFCLAEMNIPVIQLLSRDTWQDSSATVSHRILLRGRSPDLQAVAQKENHWLEKWIRADHRSDAFLKRQLNDTEELTDGHVCHHFSRLFREGWNVMTSNSFTVRDLALFSPSGTPVSRSFTNRGAAGIDGILSTAIGISHAEAGENNTAVFIGDLAFLHDSGSLAGLEKLEQTLLIIIINNLGGTIFRMLPVHDHSAVYTDYFETPQNVDISLLAKAHGIPYRLIESRQQLSDLSSGGHTAGGPLIIECRTDPDASMELRNSLWNSDGDLL